MSLRPDARDVARHEAGHVVVGFELTGRVPLSVTIDRAGDFEGRCDWSGIMPTGGALRGFPLDEILNWLAMRAAGEEALANAELGDVDRGGRRDRYDASDLLMAAIREDGGPQIFVSDSSDRFEAAATPYWLAAQQRARDRLATPTAGRMLNAVTGSLLVQRTLTSGQLEELLGPLRISVAGDLIKRDGGESSPSNVHPD